MGGGAGPAIGVIVLIIAIVAIVAVVMRGGYEDTLKQLGSPLGLQYDRRSDAFGVGSGHVLRGHVDGRTFLLAVSPSGPGNSLEEAWEIQLAGQLPHGFAAGRNGWTRTADQGTQRVQSGDAELDTVVFVQAIDAAGAWHVFADQRRKAALLALANMNGMIFSNKVMLHKSGFDNSATTLRGRLDALRSIAQAIDPVQPPPPQAYPGAPPPYPPPPYPPTS